MFYKKKLGYCACYGINGLWLRDHFYAMYILSVTIGNIHSIYGCETNKLHLSWVSFAPPVKWLSNLSPHSLDDESF